MADENEKAALGWSAAGGREFGFTSFLRRCDPLQVRRIFAASAGRSQFLGRGTLLSCAGDFSGEGVGAKGEMEIGR